MQCVNILLKVEVLNPAVAIFFHEYIHGGKQGGWTRTTLRGWNYDCVESSNLNFWNSIEVYVQGRPAGGQLGGRGKRL